MHSGTSAVPASASRTGTPTQQKLIGTYLLLALACALSGGNYVAAKYLGQQLSPLTAAALRFALSSACLMPWLLLLEGRPGRWMVRHIPMLLLLGLTGIFGFNALLFLGLQQTTASNASLITAALPIMVALLSVPLLGERLSVLRLVGISLSFLGIVYLVAQGSLSNIVELRLNQGDLLVLGAVGSSSVYTIVSKKLVDLFSSVAAITWACASGTVLLVLCAFFDPAWHDFDGLVVGGLIALLYMSTLGTIVVYVLWYRGVARVGATTSSIFTNVVPLSAVLWAAILLGEPLTTSLLISACLVLTGVFLTARGGKPDDTPCI